MKFSKYLKDKLVILAAYLIICGLVIILLKIFECSRELTLTKNEMIIFQLLLNNRQCIVTRDELMTDLWDNNEFINDNALTVNISRLRNKLQNFGLENRIETRKGQGYKLL